MKISPINNNQKISHKAVNQKYYEWAKKKVNNGEEISSEILRKLRYDVVWGEIHPQDGIDTIEAIKKLIGGSGDFIEHVLQNFKELLKN